MNYPALFDLIFYLILAVIFVIQAYKAWESCKEFKSRSFIGWIIIWALIAIFTFIEVLSASFKLLG